jgi:hypothetical protein
MNIYDVPELQQYLYPQVNQESTQLVDPSNLLPQLNYKSFLNVPRGITTISPGTSPGFVRETFIPVESFRPLNTGFADRNTNIYYTKDRENLGLFPGANNNTGITASSAVTPFGTSVDNIQGFTDKEDFSEPETKTGIAKLFEFLSNFIPGFGILKRLGDSRGIQSLNQRLRNTDFGRSKNLMDYLDIKSYGGYDEREDARAANMAQARGIQKKIDRGDYGTRDISVDRGRGQITSRPTTSRRNTSPSSSYSQASYARRR